MSISRQCEWKGTYESHSTKGELTGVEVQWERICETKNRSLEQLRYFSFCSRMKTKGSKVFADKSSQKPFYIYKAVIPSSEVAFAWVGTPKKACRSFLELSCLECTYFPSIDIRLWFLMPWVCGNFYWVYQDSLRFPSRDFKKSAWLRDDMFLPDPSTGRNISFWPTITVLHLLHF